MTESEILYGFFFPTAAMLDYPGVVRRFGTGATHAIACNSDQEVG